MANWLEDASKSSVTSAILLVLAVAGALGISNLFYRFLLGVYIYFIRPGQNLKQYGPWAVVTGATDGIGRAYADVLAAAGLNIILVSRTQEKLEDVATDISKKYNVKTEVVAADLSRPSSEQSRKLDAALSNHDIGLLINNAGRSYDHAEYFDQVDEDLVDSIIEINIRSINQMTKLVLPGMKKRKRSAIINIGSAAATVLPSGPLYAVYAGTKAYVDMFTKSLNLEYSKYGIKVQNQAPMFVATKMAKIRRPRLDAPSPKKWAKSAAKHIGYEATSCPYWVHGAMWGVAYNLPSWILDSYVLSMHKSLYIRYKKKIEKQGKRDA